MGLVKLAALAAEAKMFIKKTFFQLWKGWIAILLLASSISYAEAPRPTQGQTVSGPSPKASEPSAKSDPISITQSRDSVRRFERLELTLDSIPVYANAFDLRIIEITAYFISPTEKRIRVPGFFYQDYIRTWDNDREVLTPRGNPCWKVRFTPTEVGNYKYYIIVKDGAGEIKSEEGEFKAVASDKPGYIRVSPVNYHYFQFDSGEDFFPIGHNVCWYSSDKGTYDYDHYFSKMMETGENYARLWLSPWAFTLEWDRLGYYSLENAWRLDYVMELAEKKGIYIMLCLDTFNTLLSKPPLGRWKSNPYNLVNGGPCQWVREFFTSEQARDCHKRKLRYIVSRWGYSPNILAWQLWNEIDIIDEYNSEDIKVWHKEMANYLTQLDSYNHLITTSYRFRQGDAQVWNLPEMKFTQIHCYDRRDMAKAMLDVSMEMTEAYGKPFFAGEFGLHSGYDTYDSRGIHLHNALWSSSLSRSAGTAMSWWWDKGSGNDFYSIEQNNLYYHFKALANFLKGIRWTKSNFQPVKATAFLDNEAEAKKGGEKQSLSDSLRVIGLMNKTQVLLWIQNTANTWDNLIVGTSPETISGARIEIQGLKNGNYEVERWDTYQGQIEEMHGARVKKNILILKLPPLKTDIAYKIRNAN